MAIGNHSPAPPVFFLLPAELNYAYRIHWFCREKYLKVIMTTELHEAPAGWVLDEIQDGLARGIIPYVWVRKISITPSPGLLSLTCIIYQKTNQADHVS